MVAVPRLGTSWDLANVFFGVPNSGNYLFFTFSSNFLLVWTYLVLSFLSVFLVSDIIFQCFLSTTWHLLDTTWHSSPLPNIFITFSWHPHHPPLPKGNFFWCPLKFSKHSIASMEFSWCWWISLMSPWHCSMCPQHVFGSIKRPFFVPWEKNKNLPKFFFFDATWCFPNAAQCFPQCPYWCVQKSLDILDIFHNTARHPQWHLNVAQFPYHLKKFLNSPRRIFDAARHEVKQNDCFLFLPYPRVFMPSCRSPLLSPSFPKPIPLTWMGLWDLSSNFKINLSGRSSSTLLQNSRKKRNRLANSGDWKLPKSLHVGFSILSFANLLKKADHKVSFSIACLAFL